MTQEQKQKTLGMAITSLVLGCLFLLPILGALFSVAALTLGIISLVKISKNKETLKGQGLAIAGIVLGALGVVLIPIIALLVAIAVPNFMRARHLSQEVQAASNLRAIVVAQETYYLDHMGYTTLKGLTQDDSYYLKDSALAEGYSKGYKFNVVTEGGNNFYALAIPEDEYMGRSLYMDEDGVLCFSVEKGFKDSEYIQHVGQGCPAGFSETKR